MPTWSSVVGYEEGEPEIVSKLKCGYPRFVYHPYVIKLMEACLDVDARLREEEEKGEQEVAARRRRWDCLVLPSGRSARRAKDFLVGASGREGDRGGGTAKSGCGTTRRLSSADNAFDAAEADDSPSSGGGAAAAATASCYDSSSSPFDEIRILNLNAANVRALIFPAETTSAVEAKSYWQHAGEIVSSRRAEAALEALGIGVDDVRVTRDYVPSSREEDDATEEGEEEEEDDGGGWKDCEDDVDAWEPRPNTGEPSHLCLHPATPPPPPPSPAGSEEMSIVDDVVNRHRTFSFDLRRRRSAPSFEPLDPFEGIRKRIASVASAEDPSCVFLSPTGMSSIYSALRSARRRKLLRRRRRESNDDDDGDDDRFGGGGGGGAAVVYGFPYLDTLKLCARPEIVPDGVEFFGRGDADDLRDLNDFLRRRAEANDGGDADVCALITEFPSNPLLKCPDLDALRCLADEHDFALIVDDTIGNFANVDLLSTGLADAICTSLTKLFNGRGDAMAGSVLVNSLTEIGRWMRDDLLVNHVDHEGLWIGDAHSIRVNSADFLERSRKINGTAERLADWFAGSDDVEAVYYPKFTDPETYGKARRKVPVPIRYDDDADDEGSAVHESGYGGLMSVVLSSHVCRRTFYDVLPLSKGPSLGTNFTLVCPYALLAHYHELDFAVRYGVRPDLLRISVGLEPYDELRCKFETALERSRLHPKLPSFIGFGRGVAGVAGKKKGFGGRDRAMPPSMSSSSATTGTRRSYGRVAGGNAVVLPSSPSRSSSSSTRPRFSASSSSIGSNFLRRSDLLRKLIA